MNVKDVLSLSVKKLAFEKCLTELIRLSALIRSTRISSYLSGFCFQHLVFFIFFTFNGDFHSYYTRSRNDIRKSSATRRWGHWSAVNFSADIWNGLDTSLRNAESLPAFKRGLSKIIIIIIFFTFLLFC